jgi:hypothetical protein
MVLYIYLINKGYLLISLLLFLFKLFIFNVFYFGLLGLGIILYIIYIWW